jgi:hypothetical protein
MSRAEAAEGAPFSYPGWFFHDPLRLAPFRNRQENQTLPAQLMWPSPDIEQEAGEWTGKSRQS